MRISSSNNVYSLVLNENEWYGVSEEQQHALEHMCQVAAKEAGCRYANIMVEPDPIMSISPKANRHQVWRHTFELPIETAFSRDLQDLLDKYKRIEWVRIAAILKSFSEA